MLAVSIGPLLILASFTDAARLCVRLASQITITVVIAYFVTARAFAVCGASRIERMLYVA
jgi:hypothetical protein